MRHTDWCRVRFTETSDPDTASALIPQGRLMLGQMMQGLQLVGQRTGVLRRRLTDGSTIVVSFDGTTPVIEIDTTPAEVAADESSLTNMWVPRGFVVYPAWADATGGVGLPIVPVADTDSYDAANLAPGLARNRWTVGGPCGEVLVSPDEDAGYPPSREIPVPLLYYPTKGPVFRWTGSSSIDAQAPEAWSSYRLELADTIAHVDGDNPAEQRVLLEQVNLRRATAGVSAATLRLRGFGRPAEIMASIMAETGTDVAESASYPPTYRAPADRLTKEGYPADWMLASFTGFDRADTWSAFEFRASGSAGDAVDAWSTSSPTTLLATFGAPFADVGARDGRCCLALTGRDRWIAAGNMVWQSSDLNLPPISWHGFASLNLAWETYPARYDRVNYLTTPLVVLTNFTTATGDPWLYYPRSTTPTSVSAEPALGRHIYSRGRAIALAPEGALVWGACVIQRVVVVVEGVPVRRDRLVLLAHHPVDQPADSTHEGFTRYLRVWWADVPPRTLGMDPQQVICGTATDDPLAWRGGTLVDVGHMPAPSTGGTVPADSVSSLKYASQWRFSADGRRAVCLRDFALYADYSDMATSGLVQYDGKYPRVVELAFGTGNDDLDITTTFHDYAAGAFAAVHPSNGEYEFGAVPLAVDFASDGSLLYAYRATTVDAVAGGSPATGSTEFTYVGIGGSQVRWASELAQRAQVAASRRTSDQDFRSTGYVQVASVRRSVFVVEGMHPATVAGTLAPNPTYVSCWPFTTADAHGVRMVRGGQVIDEHWYPIPDGAVPAPLLACDVNTPGANAEAVFLPLAASANVQAYWAERFGEYVFSTVCSPLPGAVTVRNNATPDGDCGCTVSAWDIASRSHLMAFSELSPRGGHAIASVPLPDADWLIYSKVV